MTPGADTPRGFGLYLGRIVREWDADTARRHAARVKHARIRHVALCAEAADGFVAKHGVLQRAAEVYREAGALPWVYSLPHRRAWMHPRDLADRLADAGVAIAARGWVPDVEEQARGLGQQVEVFRRHLTDRAGEGVSIGVTFYGRPPAHPRPRQPGFPWAEIAGWGWAGWQAYLTASDDGKVDVGLEAVQVHWGPDVVPHVGTFDRHQRPIAAEGTDGPRRLRGDIERACFVAGDLVVPGCWLWSDASLDGEECDVLAELADRHGW